MKSFITKIFAFIFIGLVLICIEIILPYNIATFRVWESLNVRIYPILYGCFYPNKVIEMKESSDLTHHTDYETKTKVVWKTDKLGYRNDSLNSNPDILIVGDSNIVGSSLTQDSTITNLIMQYSEKSAYNVSSVHFESIVKILNDGVIKPPKMLVLSYFERDLPFMRSFDPNSKSNFIKKTAVKYPLVSTIFTQVDRIYKMNLLNFLKARAIGSKGNGIQSPINKEWFFFQGKSAYIESDSINVNKVVALIKDYSDFCRSRKIRFVFMPVPNKETLYFDYVPFESQPKFLEIVLAKLDSLGIENINLLSKYNQAKSSSIQVFHKNDTHWNVEGCRIGAKSIIEKFNSGIKSHQN